VVFNRSPDKVQELTKEGAVGAFSLADLVSKLLLLDSGLPPDHGHLCLYRQTSSYNVSFATPP
jgi:hypothetical protein